MNKSQLSIEEVRRLHQSGHLEDAKRGYLEILKADPADVTALQLLGILFAEEGNLDEAQQYLEQAIAIKSSDPALHLNLANVLKAKKSFAQAEKILLDVIRAHPAYAPAHNNLGTIYYAQEKWREAANAYQAAINIQSDYVDAYYNLGLALGKAGRRQEALNAYEALLALAPQHVGGRFQLGCVLMLMYSYKTAVEHFSVLAQTHPYHFETQTNLATCYLKLGSLDEAKLHYLNALHIDASDIQILFNLGIISMRQGDPQSAVDYYLQALQINADFFDAQNNTGIAYMALKNTDAALQHFREAARIQPGNEAIQHTIKIILRETNLSNSPPEYIRSLFDSYADHYDPHLVQTLQYQVPALFYDAVHKFSAAGKQWDVLDLGCGTGLCGDVFKSDARSLTGVDLSAKMLEIAAQKDIYGELIQSDILPFLQKKNDAYDLIIAGDVLVYFGDLAEVFSAVHGALKSHGLFVYNAEISESDSYIMTASGRFAHSKKYLDGLAKQNGLKVLEHRVTGMRMQDEREVRGHLYVLQRGM